MNNEKIFENLELMTFWLKMRMNFSKSESMKRYTFITQYMTSIYEILKDEKPKKRISKMLSCKHINGAAEPTITGLKINSELFIKCTECGETHEIKIVSKKKAAKTIFSLIEVIQNSNTNQDTKIKVIQDSIKLLMMYTDNGIDISYSDFNFDYTDTNDDYSVDDEYDDDAIPYLKALLKKSLSVSHHRSINNQYF